MRRTPVVALAVVAALLLLVAGVLYVKYQDSTAESVRSKLAMVEAQNRYTDAVNSVAEIQDSLNAIGVGDTAIGLLPRGLRAEQDLDRPARQAALERIALVRASLTRAGQRIRSLETNLRQNGIRIDGLLRMVDGLRTALVEREDRIEQLSERVDSLETKMSGLEVAVQQDQSTIQEQQQNLEERRRELATIYYILGSRRDLTVSGVIVPQGGALGIGRTLVLTNHFDESRFMPLDTDQETVIHIPANRARILSAQPADSYEIRKLGDGLQLKIIDASGFRKVKHLVILTG